MRRAKAYSSSGSVV